MSFIDAFAEAHRRGQVHFNRADYERAFAGLSADIEWHMEDRLLEAGLVKGRDAVIAHFKATSDAGAWEVDAQEFEDLGGGRVLVRQLGTATGRKTGISAQREFFQVWSVGADGLVHEVREFATRDEALG